MKEERPVAENEAGEFRPANDSRKRAPVPEQKENPVKSVEGKPGLGQRWKNLQPTKSHLVWACLATAILTMIIGFNWGGWVPGSTAQENGAAMAKEAVIQRLVPVCVAQFGLDPNKEAKLVELNEKTTSYQQSQFVRDQGWATISGVEKPDPKVANACAKLLIE
jgi:hypothetical protein